MAASPIEGPRSWPSPEWLADVAEPMLATLISLARRILRSEDLARDAVQEAFLSLWLEGEISQNPPAWLVRAVVHRCLHLARSQGRRRKHERRACMRRPESSDRDNPPRD